MFELVAMILLAIFTVMMAGFGVGKMVKLKDVAGKAVGAYVVAKAAKKILEGKYGKIYG